MAALCGDAARQPKEVKASFAQGLENMLSAIEREGTALTGVEPQAMRAKIIDTMAHAIGAIVLSRACPDDSALADEILDVCRKQILPPLRHNDV
jgi:TetR/AcrR family transcriptional repressor of nem operon